MRFAHLADTHLGYRQYGLDKRENDFYEVFHKTIDKIIESEVDFVIHSGDLFDADKPTTRALFEFQKGFFKLSEAGIPVYAVAGNHDIKRRKNSLPPQYLYKDRGLKLISPKEPYYVHGAVLICGLQYYPKTDADVVGDALEKFEKLAEKYPTAILVLHQGIDKYFNQSYELELAHIPKNFDYYAMGHLHNYIVDDFGKGKLVYPGSGEIWRTNELEDARKNGKGFCIVDLSQNPPSIERVTIDMPREFIREYVDYEQLNEKLDIIKNHIMGLENEPIVEITVENGDFDRSDVYDIINDTLGKYALHLNTNLRPNDNIVDIYPEGDETLDPRGLLKSELEKKYNSDEIGSFSVELLDNLSKNNEEEAKHIADKFYETKYGIPLYSSDNVSQESGKFVMAREKGNFEEDESSYEESANRETDESSYEESADEKPQKKVSLDNFMG